MSLKHDVHTFSTLKPQSLLTPAVRKLSQILKQLRSCWTIPRWDSKGSLNLFTFLSTALKSSRCVLKVIGQTWSGEDNYVEAVKKRERQISTRCLKPVSRQTNARGNRLRFLATVKGSHEVIGSRLGRLENVPSLSHKELPIKGVCLKCCSYGEHMPTGVKNKH